MREALGTLEIIFLAAEIGNRGGRGVFKSQGISSECSRGSLDPMNVELMEEARV